MNRPARAWYATCSCAGARTAGSSMVCLVCTRPQLPHSEQLVAELCAKFPAIATILLNVNSKNTNVILGSKTLTLYGPGTIEDTLCGVPVRLGPLSFYQVNTLAAEQLYRTAAQMAQLAPGQLLLDLYCGMGTIGLSMAEQCGSLIGVEIIPEAVDSAKANTAQMGPEVAAKSRFLCADAGQAATQLAAEGLHPDVVMLDTAPQRLRRGDPVRCGADVPPAGGLCKLQPSHSRTGCCLAAAARLLRTNRTAGRPVPPHKALRMCPGFSPHRRKKLNKNTPGEEKQKAFPAGGILFKGYPSAKQALLGGVCAVDLDLGQCREGGRIVRLDQAAQLEPG